MKCYLEGLVANHFANANLNPKRIFFISVILIIVVILVQIFLEEKCCFSLSLPDFSNGDILQIGSEHFI